MTGVPKSGRRRFVVPGGAGELGAGRKKSPMDHSENQVAVVIDPGFLEDPSEMRVHGFHGDAEFLRDVGPVGRVEEALGKLDFPRRKLECVAGRSPLASVSVRRR